MSYVTQGHVPFVTIMCHMSYVTVCHVPFVTNAQYLISRDKFGQEGSQGRRLCWDEWEWK